MRSLLPFDRTNNRSPSCSRSSGLKFEEILITSRSVVLLSSEIFKIFNSDYFNRLTSITSCKVEAISKGGYVSESLISPPFRHHNPAPLGKCPWRFPVPLTLLLSCARSYEQPSG